MSDFVHTNEACSYMSGIPHSNHVAFLFYCHTCQDVHNWVISRIRMRHVPYMNEWYPTFESCHTSILVPHLPNVHKWVISCVQMRHVPYMNESYPTFESFLFCCHTCQNVHKWIISRLQMRHVPHMNKSCPIFELCHTSILLPHLPGSFGSHK